MKIQELMHHHPITVQKDASLETAAQLLQKLDVRHLPVLDGTKLVGMISDRDLAPVLFDDPLAAKNDERHVAHLMEADVITISPDAPAREAADQMAERRIGALPVVEDGHVLVGIVSYVDILKAIAETLRN